MLDGSAPAGLYRDRQGGPELGLSEPWPRCAGGDRKAFSIQLKIKLKSEVSRKLTKAMKLAPEVDLEVIARNTEGFTGADLKAVLYTAQLGKLDKILIFFWYITYCIVCHKIPRQ